MLSALVERELGAVARAHHRAHPEGASAVRIVTWLGALLPRVMFPGSLAAAARYAGAEPLWTGRRRAYAESTLRQAADRLDAEGASTHVARAVWKQVEGAVAKVDDEVIAHTDMFDQPCYTEKLAHAAPIGRPGNRLLALNALYKSRWPSMENELKGLQSRGFGRNRTRRLELTVSRGTDGELLRLRDREEARVAKVREQSERPVSGRSFERLVAASRKVREVRETQAVVAAQDRRRQAALIEVFNKLALRCRGSVVVIHTRDRAVGKAA